jgi:hypothetical protein
VGSLSKFSSTPKTTDTTMAQSGSFLSSQFVYIAVALLLALAGYRYNDAADCARSGGVVHSDGLPTVLVTGGMGFIGSHVVEDLLANGFHVRLTVHA